MKFYRLSVVIDKIFGKIFMMMNISEFLTHFLIYFTKTFIIMKEHVR